MTGLALLGAALAALCYGAGSILQSIGARRVQPGQGAGLVTGLARQLPYLAGLALDLAGFAASVLALRTLPLFLVQCAVAASVGVTALLAAAFLDVRLTRIQTGALAGLGVGLTLLAVAATAQRGSPLSSAGGWALLGALGGVAALGAAGLRGPGDRAAAILAAAAGLGYAGVGIAARVLVIPASLVRLLTEPAFFALLGYGVLGTLLFAAALQRGSVTVVAAVTFAVETIVPAAIGLAVLGDSARPGFAPVAALGFVLTLAGALALARYAEPPTAPALMLDR